MQRGDVIRDSGMERPLEFQTGGLSRSPGGGRAERLQSVDFDAVSSARIQGMGACHIDSATADREVAYVQRMPLTLSRFGDGGNSRSKALCAAAFADFSGVGHRSL